jgi:hypothetical protein
MLDAEPNADNDRVVINDECRCSEPALCGVAGKEEGSMSQQFLATEISNVRLCRAPTVGKANAQLGK